MIYITIVLLFVIECGAWFRYKDLLNPAVIHNVFWLLSTIGLCFLIPGVDISFSTALLIVGGSLLFQIGYSAVKVKKIGIVNYELKTKSIKLAIFIMFIPFSFVIVQYYRSGLFLDATLYESLSEDKEELQIPAYMSYVFRLIQFFTLALLVLYWKNNDKQRKKEVRYWILFLFSMGLVCTLSTPTRNGMLFFFAPLIVLYLYTHVFSKKKIVFFLLLSLGLFLSYFYFISLGKYWYKYDSGESSFVIIGREVLSYLSGSIYALDVTMDVHEYTRLGSDTFRYFIAIYDSLFKTNNCPELVNDFINKKISTNVYTFYDYYIRDFGAWYAAFLQFVFSTIHAYAFKFAKQGALMSIFFSALLTYPLLMQFFQDQYASLMSTWIQAVFVALVVFKSHCFIISKVR